jgi:acetylornithine deacetylase/succinyl-diaminopimelate desuccinylase-like protein
MKRTASYLIALQISFCMAMAAAISSDAQSNDAANRLAHDIFRQLIEINTTDSVGNVTTAAEAMATRLRDAGYPESDVQVIGPNDRKKNLVARLHGTGAHKPILLICHLDVVEARREDWSINPFQFIEKDGYFYGRGTEDIKDGDAILMSAMIRMKQEGYKPDRDIILALTADEEGGDFNGVEWLHKNHPELIDADFVLNPDAGYFEIENGKKSLVGIQASEKIYQDFELKVTNRGGHSSLPTPDNAIYQLADGLARLQQFKFPFELNEVSRAYFERTADIVSGSVGADMKAIAKTPPDTAAMARLEEIPYYNARMRTTCVATMLQAGHARNALPGMATANVNCRILPGHTSEETKSTLEKVLNDPGIKVSRIVTLGAGALPTKPSPLRPDVMGALEKVVSEMWPGLPVVPQMDAGASDSSILRVEGIPVYGVVGVFSDIEDDRSHGRDERVRVASFYEGVDFYYRLLKTLTSQQ